MILQKPLDILRHLIKMLRELARILRDVETTVALTSDDHMNTHHPTG